MVHDMPANSKNGPRLALMRKNIAALAARLMAEDGVADYGLAKRKAARQLGAADTEALPTNSEVETELRTYQALYQGDEQRMRLQQLRQKAVEAMRILAPFNPYLSGPVLDGTAGRYAEIELEAFPDSAKELEIFLLNRSIPFEQSSARRTGFDTPECVLTLDWEQIPIRLSVYPPDAERMQRRNPHNGRSLERARLAAVEALLAAYQS